MKRYLPRFLALPFRAEPGGADALLAAIDVARKIGSGELAEVPADAPVHFAPLRGEPPSSTGVTVPTGGCGSWHGCSQHPVYAQGADGRFEKR